MKNYDQAIKVINNQPVEISLSFSFFFLENNCKNNIKIAAFKSIFPVCWFKSWLKLVI